MLSDKIESILKRDLNDAAKLHEAVTEIEIALASAAESAATPDQLADLADAIDAFRDRAYGVAASLARAAANTRRKVDYSRRPASMTLSLAELRESFARARARATAISAPSA
jgi:hypothetical protein